MSNTFSPNGFNQYRGNGSAPTYEQVQGAISYADARPVFFGDPVVQATQASTGSTPGAPTGFLTQGYSQVGLTVGATGLATSATGALTATFSAPAVAGGNTALPTNWTPPVGSKLVVSGSTPPTLDGTYDIGSGSATTAVCLPDLGVPASTTSSAVGTVTLFMPTAGIFTGCKYLSVAQKRTVWGNYWPGSDCNPNTNVTAYFINDTNAQFDVQGGNSNTTMTAAIAFAAIGQNIGYAYAAPASSAGASGNGNTANGLSTAFADQNTLQGFNPPAAPNLLPFRVVELKNYTPDGSNPLQGVNGNDYTSPFNRIVVAFNNAMLKQLSGI